MNTKNLIRMLSIIVSVAFIASSCKKPEPDEPGTETTKIVDPIQSDLTSETRLTETEASYTSPDTLINITEEQTQCFVIGAAIGWVTALNNSGGNPGNCREIKITISESRCYYDNSEISSEELVELLDSLNQNDTVIVHDDYASDKAFENLTSILKEREIPYTVE